MRSRPRVVAKREFAGYWEYVLDEALFTAPAAPELGRRRLHRRRRPRSPGIGSLFVQEARGEGIASQGNMIVPIDLLTPILDDLLTLRPGRPAAAAVARHVHVRRPTSTVFVAGARERRPGRARRRARRATSCSRSPAPRVSDLADTFRRIWAIGPAGSRDPAHPRCATARCSALTIASADRNDFLKKPRLH